MDGSLTATTFPAPNGSGFYEVDYLTDKLYVKIVNLSTGTSMTAHVTAIHLYASVNYFSSLSAGDMTPNSILTDNFIQTKLRRRSFMHG